MDNDNLLFESSINTRDEVYELISWWKKDKVRNAKVMVIGAGALGNEVLKNLALLNVGNILIVDYDTIEFSNLSRSLLFREKDAINDSLKSKVSADRVKDLNPEVKVMDINADINNEVGLGIFRRMDAIIGCLDNRLARLSINKACYKLKKPWVDGAIENLAGQATVYVPEKSCYECGLSDREKQAIERAQACMGVANRSIIRGRIPTTPISASIIGAIQVQEALKIIHNYDENSQEAYFQTLKNKVYRYDGKIIDTGIFEFEPIKENCDSHYYYDEIIEAEELSSKSTVSDLLEWAINKFGDKGLEINLKQQFIYELIPKKTGIKIPVKLPQNKVANYIETHNLRGSSNEEVYLKGYHTLTFDFPYQDMTLSEVGIPPLHIFEVEIIGEVKFIELTGDKNFINFK